MRRPNVLIPLDRTMQLPLTLAGGYGRHSPTLFPPPLPVRAALVHRLQDDRNERSGEERKWGDGNRTAALFGDEHRMGKRRSRC
jgi:hypothetical protein